MKKLLFITLNVFILAAIYAQSINNYEFEKAAGFIAGSKEDEIGYKPEFRKGGLQVSPSGFTITGDGYIYVCDSVNARINVYDLDFNFIKAITENWDIAHVYDIKVDSAKNIIAFDSSKGLIKTDNKGKELFIVPNNKFPAGTIFYYPYEEYILFYNNGIKLIDNEGKFITDDKAIKKVQEISEKAAAELEKNGIDLLCGDVITQFLEMNKIVKKGNILLSDNFEVHRKYFHKINEKLKTMNKDIDKIKVEDKISEQLFKGAKLLIGFDTDGNSYWENRAKGLKVIVLSRYGEILDVFDTNSKPYALKAVAPNGDVYFLNVVGEADNKIVFYKISRRW